MRSGIQRTLLDVLAFFAAATAGILLLRAFSISALVICVTSENQVLIACSRLLYNAQAIASPLWQHFIDILCCVTGAVLFGLALRVLIQRSARQYDG